MTRDLAEKGWVPVRYWVAWWTALALAVVLFYVVLTPVWIGIRVAGWLAARRGGRHRRSLAAPAQSSR